MPTSKNMPCQNGAVAEILLRTFLIIVIEVWLVTDLVCLYLLDQDDLSVDKEVERSCCCPAIAMSHRLHTLL